MSLLFSKVTIQSDSDEVEFMVGGFPTEPDFLSDQCDCIGEADFEIQWSPDESYL